MTTAESYKWVLFSLTLWREARGRSHEEKRAIAHVIANRAADPQHRYGKSLVAVLIAPMQFTSIAPPHSPVTNFNEWINATSWPLDSDPNWQECCAIADSIGNATDGPDPTNGASNYYSLPIEHVPAWADPSKLTLTLGVFRFFRLS